MSAPPDLEVVLAAASVDPAIHVLRPDDVISPAAEGGAEP
jgi:hypothetical protein